MRTLLGGGSTLNKMNKISQALRSINSRKECYVDSLMGDDLNDGLSESSAFKTLSAATAFFGQHSKVIIYLVGDNDVVLTEDVNFGGGELTISTLGGAGIEFNGGVIVTSNCAVSADFPVVIKGSTKAFTIKLRGFITLHSRTRVQIPAGSNAECVVYSEYGENQVRLSGSHFVSQAGELPVVGLGAQAAAWIGSKNVTLTNMVER
ncbi:hypothetical protein ACMAZF_01330 [Psychrobium sp. nBUS_13]|uniref:hypothetical protein n=1 Tax=Psychrobium sp. nBUS_13 TaxID=3395319 RepID=UPI003EBE8CCD